MSQFTTNSEILFSFHSNLIVAGLYKSYPFGLYTDLVRYLFFTRDIDYINYLWVLLYVRFHCVSLFLYTGPKIVNVVRLNSVIYVFCGVPYCSVLLNLMFGVNISGILCLLFLR